MTLETTNPSCFTYKTEESATADRLLIELLGGVRIDTLDRMRVTIKGPVINRKHKEYLNDVELAGLSLRHNLDLYNREAVQFLDPRYYQLYKPYRRFLHVQSIYQLDFI